MRAAFALGLVMLATTVAGCAATSTAEAPAGRVPIVAAENFWGAVAAQLAGARGYVRSLITNPAADPHDYEPTVDDAKRVSAARLVIVNGIGYDRWASQLLAASPASGRRTLDVGRLLDLHEGENPHRWYSPQDVEAVADRITAELTQIDPSHADYYHRRREWFETSALTGYRAAIDAIRRRYAGTPVGASESIFALLAPSLGLHLITPSGFMAATSEGTDVSAQDTITAQNQIAQGQIKVWVYNAQNVTPAVQRLNALARAHHIPLVTITETLSPARSTFEAWQTGQLDRLGAALRRATGR